MTAYEQEMEALATRVRSLELGAELLAQSTTEAVHRLDERLEKLEAADKDRGERQLYWEKHLSVELRNMNDLINESKLRPLFSHREQLGELKTRIEALEEKATSVDCVRVHRDIAEDERQDRWHATYNAALPSFLDCGHGNTRALEQAAAAADRAHGPLEAKAAVETYNMTAAYVAEVNALVKAAIGMQCAAAEMLRAPHEESSRDWLSAASDALGRCVKPFEVKP